MWFKHRAWIPIAWLLSVGNLIAAWFAARPGEPWHATIHAALAVLFGLGAQQLGARKRALQDRGSQADLRADITALREELTALGEAHSDILERLDFMERVLTQVREAHRELPSDSS